MHPYSPRPVFITDLPPISRSHRPFEVAIHFSGFGIYRGFGFSAEAAVYQNVPAVIVFAFVPNPVPYDSACQL
jgi:hypothetical protein